MAALLLVALSAGCRPAPGAFVWVDEFNERTAAEGDYVIGPGDLLKVMVYNQDNITSRVRVRADGRISLPFVYDLDAAGLTPVALSKRVEDQLKAFINNPLVTVSLDEVRTLSVSVLGEVVRPGAFNLEPGSGVLHALAMAGGLNPFAHHDSVFLLRRVDGAAVPTRVRFAYPKLARAEGKSGTFALRWGDVIVVE